MIFKITPLAAWNSAIARGLYEGSADDLRDGFIHFSARHQLEGTAAKYFRNQPDLVLIAFDAASFGPALKWEASRGGDLFPHLYGSLSTSSALWVRELPLGADGVPFVPKDITVC